MHAVTKQVVRRWKEIKEERHDDLQGVPLARHDMGRIAPVLRQARRSRADRGGGQAKARSAIIAPASNTQVGSR